MATPARYFQKGQYYHVYNRGIRKQDIFLGVRDYDRFLRKMSAYKDGFKVSIFVYCLMPNHYHFLLRQDSDIPLTAFMLRLGTSYAKYFNIKYDQVGSLFQDRFKVKLVETEEYLLELSRYIHRNPKDIQGLTPGVELAGVELANYRWSSYKFYVGEKKSDLVDTSFILDYFAKNDAGKDYRQFVEYDFKEKDLLTIEGLLLEDI